MTISRRSFIKSSIFAGTGIIISPAFACKGSPGSFLKEIGICTNISKLLPTVKQNYESIVNLVLKVPDWLR